jgi:hypothetical protein
MPIDTVNEASRITTIFLIIQCTEFSIVNLMYNIGQSRGIVNAGLSSVDASSDS